MCIRDSLEGAAESGPAESVTPVRSVDALLALQEVEDSTSNQARARQRAERLIDHLRGIQLDLLEGRMSRDRLEEIQETVQERRESSDDPRLDALLNDIETRAAVELAKYQRDE